MSNSRTSFSIRREEPQAMPNIKSNTDSLTLNRNETIVSRPGRREEVKDRPNLIIVMKSSCHLEKRITIDFRQLMIEPMFNIPQTLKNMTKTRYSNNGYVPKSPSNIGDETQTSFLKKAIIISRPRTNSMNEYRQQEVPAKTEFLHSTVQLKKNITWAKWRWMNSTN